MSSPRPRQFNEAQDRLTRITERLIHALMADPEYSEDIQAAFMLDNPVERMGGIGLHNYADAKETVVNLFGHLRALVRSQGMDLEFIALPEDPTVN